MDTHRVDFFTRWPLWHLQRTDYLPCERRSKQSLPCGITRLYFCLVLLAKGQSANLFNSTQTLNISLFFWYTIISYHLPKKRYNIIYIISWKEWYDRTSYIILLWFQKNWNLAIFYILFINNQSSKHTKRRNQLSLIIFYSNNGHKLTSKRAVKSTKASNLWRGNLKLGQKWKRI
jgi:hypothetical protein